MIYPLVYGIGISFHFYDLTMPHLGKPFIGLKNYADMLNDPYFWNSLKNTFFWVFECVLFQFLIGLAVALVINQSFKGRGLVRSILLVPWATPIFVSSLMWNWLYHPQIGMINDVLMRVGFIDRPHAWLTDPTMVLHHVVIAQTWAGFPFFAVMLLAGLQAIPDELYEAAIIDGAGVFQRFFRITLPMLSGTIVITTVLRTIWTSKTVIMIYVMTGGGPAHASETLVIYSLQKAYAEMDFGYASALATTLLVILMIFSTIYVRLLRGRGIYGYGCSYNKLLSRKGVL